MSHNDHKYTLGFITIICLVASFLLSIVALTLLPRQEKAKQLDQQKQLLIAAKILSHQGYFIIKEENSYQPAHYNPKTNILVKSTKKNYPTNKEIWQIYQKRIEAKVVDANGNLYSFKEAGLNKKEYITAHAKNGYAQLRYKLIYLVYDANKTKPAGYVVPINGFGLWDAIYGYLAIDEDGITVIGTTWYEQAETAGLGANIALPSWQKQFEGKVIFQPNKQGEIAPQNAYIGIKAVKGKVKDIYGSSPKAENAVDGVTGASLTMKGVTDAYHNCLAPYRPFFVQVYNQ